MKVSHLFLPLSLFAMPAAAQTPAVFGVYDPGSFVEGNASRFRLCHDGRRFLTAECPRLVDTLAAGNQLAGVDSAGRYAIVQVREVRAWHGDLYEAPYTVAAALETGDSTTATLLFWQAQAEVRPVAPVETQLDSTALALLADEAQRLYREAEALRAPGDRSEGMVLGTPRALAVEGEERMVVHWPASLAFGAEHDDRASLFFVYDPGRQRIVRGVFGHGEWAPVSPERVQAIQPVLFFRVGRDRHTYFLARRTGPWELIGFGIYEMHGGELVAPDV